MGKFCSKMMIMFVSGLFIISSSLFTSSYAQNCEYRGFSNNIVYAGCNALPVLDSFLHWNYHPSNHTVDIAYRRTGVDASNWIVWALNPGGGRMIGSQCLVAFRNSTGQIHAYTSPITGYDTTLQEGLLSFQVPMISAEFSGNQMIIYATIQLPNGTTSFTHLWQSGVVSGNTLQQHSITGPNIRSFGTIDFSTGATADTGSAAGGSRNRRRNIHGVVNVVSWGILLPMGAMMARYLKVFKSADPAWFYLHVFFQTSGYIVGVAGWGTGLRLGSDSPGVQRTTHRNIGITLFALGTLQLFALLLRPKPDHKYRLYWNIYHRSIGYTVIILSIINIFKGFDILDPEDKWRIAYIGVLVFLGAIALVLEIYTWYVVMKTKPQAPAASNKHPHANGTHQEVIDGHNVV